jgi:Peptidase dimerisation domain
MIGYSGLDKVVIGGRGFLRAQVTLYGEADHSGSSRSETNNAVERAAAWVEDLTQRRRPQLPADDKTFGPPPKLTVTAIHGGHGYSTLPDCCTVNVDVRLTPTFDRQAAVDLLEEAAREFDRRWPAPRPTRLDYLESWPPYRLSKRLPPCAALTEAAACYLPNAPRMKVAGPSNIGNYLAQLGIPATAGFGVVYRGLHGTDESINLVAVILFPVCAGMSAAARELVRVVVGHQWGPAGALVPWLAFAGGFAVLAKLSRALAEARAELNRSLAAQGAQLPMLATRLLLSARSGQLWLFAAAVAASGLARLLAYLALMRRVLALRLAELARALAPAVLTSAAAGLAVAGARHALVGTAPVAVVFAVEVAAGAVALALCLRLAALAQVRAELGRRLADVGLRGAAGSWRRRLLMLAVGPTEPVAAGGLHLARPRHLTGRGR